MDSMLEHPGTELQVLIKEKGLTQKAFASILGKKVSEVNELLKGKRNITIQRDYLLHQHLGTPIKYWILKQIDYDYSLLDIQESSDSSLSTQGEENEVSQDSDTNLSDGEVYSASGKSTSHQASQSVSEDHKIQTTILPTDLQEEEQDNIQDFSSSLHSHPEQQTKPQETPIQEQKYEDDEDFKKRAKIFRSF